MDEIIYVEWIDINGKKYKKEYNIKIQYY